MSLHLDHVLIAVHSLERAAETYSTRLGFTLTPEGAHPGRGTHNRLIVFAENYLELIAVRDSHEGVFRQSMVEMLKRREGLYMFAMGTPDVAAEAAAMQGRGVDVGEPALGTRDAQGNAPAYTWEAAPVASDATPGSETFLIQHHMAMSERYTQPPDASRHANGATGVAGLALAVPDVSVAAAAWERVLGRRPEPVQERASEAGHRARFALGGLWLDVVDGAGPLGFPVALTLKTEKLEATAAFLRERGVRFVRGRDGADAVIAVPPQDAHGATLRFTETG